MFQWKLIMAFLLNGLGAGAEVQIPKDLIPPDSPPIVVNYAKGEDFEDFVAMSRAYNGENYSKTDKCLMRFNTNSASITLGNTLSKSEERGAYRKYIISLSRSTEIKKYYVLMHQIATCYNSAPMGKMLVTDKIGEEKVSERAKQFRAWKEMFNDAFASTAIKSFGVTPENIKAASAYRSQIGIPALVGEKAVEAMNMAADYDVKDPKDSKKEKSPIIMANEIRNKIWEK